MKQLKDCIFCQVLKGESPSWKVYENNHVYAFLDINPASRYHTLIIPKNHYRDIFEIPDFELREVISVVGKLAKFYKEKLGIEHLQVINSNGAEGQQDVFHIHYHIIPRNARDGQNIKWTVHREWREDFDEMLKKLDL